MLGAQNQPGGENAKQKGGQQRGAPERVAPLPLRRGEPDLDEIAGHVGGESAAQPQIADRIDIAGDAGEQRGPEHLRSLVQLSGGGAFSTLTRTAVEGLMPPRWLC